MNNQSTNYGNRLTSWLRAIYSSWVVQNLLHTDVANLKLKIDPNWRVLDVGCGSDPPLLRAVQPRAYVGVDAYGPSIDLLRARPEFGNVFDHTSHVAEIQSLEFPDRFFDAVVIVDVIEHLSKEDGITLLRRAARWANECVYISTPNGFLRQDPYDSNFYQEHLSGWTVDELVELGFTTILGGGGLRCLRKKEMQPDQWSHVSGSSMRWRPYKLWSIISALSQLIVYRYPRACYQLHATLKVNQF